MNTKARVLITKDCNRKCPHCCSEFNTVMSTMRETTIPKLASYGEVMITGGEPMLYPERVKTFINLIREQNSTTKIYLYTALFTPELIDIIPLLDGIHYTLHIRANQNDVDGFTKFQEAVKPYHTTMSVRSYIDPAVELPVTIYPWLYYRLEVKPWIMEGECPLPDGEDLLYLREAI